MYKQALFTFLVIAFLLTPLTEAQTFLNTKKILNPPNPSLFTKDKFGNYYAAYNFSGPLVIDTFHLTSFTPGTDIALAKFDSTGNCLWVKQAYGKMGMRVLAQICDTDGNIIMAGQATDTVFFDSIFVPIQNDPMSSDIFVAKYSPAGKCLWARGFGTYEGDNLGDIDIDEQNNVYLSGMVTGRYQGSISFDTIVVTPPQGQQTCLLKLNKQGRVVWAKTPGAQDFDGAQSIKVKPSGGFYVAGYTGNNAIFDTITIRHNGIYKLYFAEYNPSGMCTFAKALGGSPINYGGKISYDDSGYIYLSGLCGSNAYFDSLYLPTGSNNYLNTFIAKFNRMGNCVWVKSATIPNYEKFVLSDVTADNLGNCYVTGWFKDTLSIDRMQVISKGGKDIFFAKFGPTGRCIGLVRAGGTGDDGGSSISYSPSGLITAYGYFSGTADFGATTLTGGGYFTTQFTDITTDFIICYGPIPAQLKIIGVYPNPLNVSANVMLDLPTQAAVTVTLYNTLGERVKEEYLGTLEPNTHNININASGLTGGIYYCRITAGKETRTTKLMLLR